MRGRRVRAVLAGVCLAWSLVPSVSAAPAKTAKDTGALEQMIELNWKALDDYAAGRPGDARSKLLEAVAVGTRAGLDDHNVMARSYLHLWVVFSAGFEDEARAEPFLDRALAIRPDIALTPQISTAALERGFAAAKARRGAAAAGTATDDEIAGERPKRERGILDCVGPDEVTAADPALFKCRVPREMRVSELLLYFRVPPEEGFTVVPASPQEGGRYSVSIPANATTAKVVHYYFEARDPRGTILADDGTAISPNIVIVRPAEPPVSGTEHQGTVSRVDADSENPLLAITGTGSSKARPKHRFFVAAGAGSGYGWHPRRQLETHEDFVVLAGRAPGGNVHLLPEIGYRLTERVAISAQMRLQLIDVASSEGGGAWGDMALLGRVQYSMGGGRTRLTTSANVGGGGFRLLVPPDSKGMIARDDTLRAGPIVLGPGLGLLHRLTDAIGLSVELRTLVGIPLWAAVLDLGAGVQLGF